MLAFAASAQQEINVLDLGLQGKLTETVNPFDRFNADEYPAVYDDAKTLITQVRSSAGYFVAFKSDTKNIRVKINYRKPEHYGPCDLYIKKDGRWLYAGSQTQCRNGRLIDLVRHMDGSEHECIVYFPLQQPIESMKLIIDSNASIESIDCPFRHRIAALGSSFTQGAGVTRPGLTWSAQLSRMTGLMFINMGFCGNCKLQPFYAQVLGRSDAEAYVIDAFSNPSAQEVKDRLYIFIDTLREAEKEVGKDPKPIIFLRTIWREGNNFNVKKREREEGKIATAEEMMASAVKDYELVYWVNTTDATDYKYHETCTDGTHPNDYGYTLWAESILKPVTKILAKYNIK
jgi:hypothetical protein